MPQEAIYYYFGEIIASDDWFYIFRMIFEGKFRRIFREIFEFAQKTEATKSITLIKLFVKIRKVISMALVPFHIMHPEFHQHRILSLWVHFWRPSIFFFENHPKKCKMHHLLLQFHQKKSRSLPTALIFRSPFHSPAL